MPRVPILLLFLVLCSPALADEEPDRVYPGTVGLGLTGRVEVMDALACPEGQLLVSLSTRGPCSLEWPSGLWLDLETRGSSDSLLVRFDAKGKALWAVRALGPGSERPTQLIALPGGDSCWAAAAPQGVTLEWYRPDLRRPASTARLAKRSAFLLRLDAQGRRLASADLSGASITTLAPASQGVALLGVPATRRTQQVVLPGKREPLELALGDAGSGAFLAILDADLDAVLATQISTGAAVPELAAVTSESIYVALRAEGKTRFSGPLGRVSPTYGTEVGREGCIMGPIPDPFLTKFDLTTGELDWSAQLASPGSDYLFALRQQGDRLYLAAQGYREVEYLRGRGSLASLRSDDEGMLFSVDLEGRDPSVVDFERPFSANVEILGPKRLLLWGTAGEAFSLGGRALPYGGRLDAFLLETDIAPTQLRAFTGLRSPGVEQGVALLRGSELRLLSRVREGLRVTLPAKPLAGD